MKTLIIGYGNTLRGDDGAGYLAVEQVAAWDLPTVGTIACHQLVPELAEPIAECDRVIFIDAALPHAQAQVRFIPLHPTAHARIEAHLSDPIALLALVQQLYGRSVEAHHLLIPTASMELSETLSPIAQAGIAMALDQLKCWLASR